MHFLNPLFYDRHIILIDWFRHGWVPINFTFCRYENRLLNVDPHSTQRIPVSHWSKANKELPITELGSTQLRLVLHISYGEFLCEKQLNRTDKLEIHTSKDSTRLQCFQGLIPGGGEL